MKNRAKWLWIPALALSVGACKKNDGAKAPDAPVVEAPANSTLEPAVTAAAPTVPKLSTDERAAKLGFVKHLPQDTEVVLAFHNGSKSVSRFKASKLWQMVEAQLVGGVGALPDQEMEEDIEEMPEGEQADAAPQDAEAEEPMGPATLFGTEFTMALGKTSGEQVGNLFTFYSRMGYFQMRSTAKAFASAVKSGDTSALQDALTDQYGEAVMNDVLKDPESGVKLLEKSKMPPIYLAFKTGESDREAGAQWIASMVANVAMLGEMVEPIEMNAGSVPFSGFKILGRKISESMATDREGMDSSLGAETVDQLLAVVAKKDLVVLSGSVGDYVVLFLGSSQDDLKFAADPGQSMVGSDAFAFTDAYASKEIAAIGYGDKQAMDQLIASSGGLAEMANGLRDGLAGADGLGDTRDLEAMFQIVAEREAALRKLASYESSGMVAYFEDGLKIESYGGADSGMVDWGAPSKLSHLGDSEDVVLFANATADAAYNEKVHAYLEALLETGYAVTMKIAEAPLEGPEMEQFKSMAKMFDDTFRADMVSLWDSFSHEAGASLGQETALVVDLKGSAPAVPGIPQKVLDEAKVPRISWIAPVRDRAKLSGAWDKMNTTLIGTLARISEMTGANVPMQKPISSEKDGNTTWFMSMPFLTDDFLPSVTVGDQWFAASTSRNQALDLIGKAAAAPEERGGFWFSLNFKALQTYAESSYKLIDANSEALMGGPIPTDQRRMIEDSIAALGDLDKLTVHARREGSVMRSSIHFKTR